MITTQLFPIAIVGAPPVLHCPTNLCGTFAALRGKHFVDERDGLSENNEGPSFSFFSSPQGCCDFGQ